MDEPAGVVARASSPESYPFLNHFPRSVHSNLPPSVDDKLLARQKRKRTSPEDAAVLEAAYLRDPKPDRVARLELVKGVALGEKEVQIWFQNRRQTSRRKSRPLLPHEIAQYSTSRIDMAEPNFRFGNCDERLLEHDRPRSSQSCDSDQSQQSEDDQILPSVPVQTIPPQSEQSPSRLPSEAPRSVESGPAVSAALPECSATLGYLANRRSASSLPHSLSEKPMLSPPVATIAPERQLKKTQSFVRLSMNAEGKAEIVTKDASSPSPPRPQQIILPDIRGFLHPKPLLPPVRSLQRSFSDRSRDSRSWEFWCDKEARTELGNAAEKAASGSAAGAIGLLRTASGRNILGTVPSKRNSGQAPQATSIKRSKLDHKRQFLQRSSTSTGRLQGEKPPAPTMPKLKKFESANFAKGTDSDKENVSPDPESTSDSQPFVSRRQNWRTNDVSNGNPAGRNRLLKTATGERGRAGELDANADPEKDDEVAAFMRGGSKSDKVSANDDLDCVQGLLSLSQGNWR